MAHTKAKGTSKLGRDSESKRLGVKIFGGSSVKCGQIIVRQRGTYYMAGKGTKIGKDDTLYAVRDGVVEFKKIRYTNFTGNKQMKQVVSVSETKLKVKGEKLKVNEEPENFNSKETEEVMKKEPKEKLIREVELPKIPARKDNKK